MQMLWLLHIAVYTTLFKNNKSSTNLFEQTLLAFSLVTVSTNLVLKLIVSWWLVSWGHPLWAKKLLIVAVLDKNEPEAFCFWTIWEFSVAELNMGDVSAEWMIGIVFFASFLFYEAGKWLQRGIHKLIVLKSFLEATRGRADLGQVTSSAQAWTKTDDPSCCNKNMASTCKRRIMVTENEIRSLLICSNSVCKSQMAVHMIMTK